MIDTCFTPSWQGRDRYIHLNGKVEPRIKTKNLIRNQKYNIFTFVPLVLFNQFKYFFNFFYLLISVSQFVPALKVGFLFTYISPLIFVLLLTMVKDAYDDYKRMMRDKEANSAQYVCYTRGKKEVKQSAQLQPGDLIYIQTQQRIPADLVLLATTEATGTVFIRTDQLDGETDWKVRRAIGHTQQLIKFDYLESASLLNGYVQCDPPNDQIYEFKGLFKQVDQNKSEPLNLENTLWTNTILATGQVLGLVLYTGKETRSSLNQRKPITKQGKFDQEVNQISKKLFGLMVFLSFMLMLLGGFTSSMWLIRMFRYLLLLSSIIPISLRVNLDFAKAYFSYKISSDPKIPNTVARNSNIPEELGRIEYILTDKTGTLTQNEMTFKKMIINEQLITKQNIQELKSNLAKMAAKYNGPLADIPEEDISKNKRRKNEFIQRDFITALILCHNVTPAYEQLESGPNLEPNLINNNELQQEQIEAPKDSHAHNTHRSLQASSPDELALVQFAESLQYLLVQRSDSEMKIQNPNNQAETYQILVCFPFSSETKRMGIIVRQIETQKIIFYLKGADAVMIQKVKSVYKGIVNDDCDNLAREGLRTLVITQKQLTQEDYARWKQEYDAAALSMGNRQQLILQL